MESSKKPKSHGTYCCVVGCHNRTRREEMKFFPFPTKSQMQRMAWIKAVTRKDWIPKKYDRICQAHFYGGIMSQDPGHPSYAPTIFPTNHTSPMSSKLVERYKRAIQRRSQEYSRKENLKHL